MKIKKTMKKIKKFNKKLKRCFSNKKCGKKPAACCPAQPIKPLPFMSIFAAVKVQKERSSAFLMAGNDISKIRTDAYAPICPEPENITIDASVKIELKNQESF